MPPPPGASSATTATAPARKFQAPCSAVAASAPRTRPQPRGSRPCRAQPSAKRALAVPCMTGVAARSAAAPAQPSAPDCVA